MPVDYNPARAGRRMVGRLRRRRRSTSRSSASAGCCRAAGIDAPADMPLARAAEARAGADGRRATTARERSTRPSAPTSATAWRTSRRSTTRHVLVLGRVTSGPGGDDIVDGAREVLEVEFPELARQIAFHVPDEHDKRHGQAIAAASLPASTR